MLACTRRQTVSCALDVAGACSSQVSKAERIQYKVIFFVFAVVVIRLTYNFIALLQAEFTLLFLNPPHPSVAKRR